MPGFYLEWDITGMLCYPITGWAHGRETEGLITYGNGADLSSMPKEF